METESSVDLREKMIINYPVNLGSMLPTVVVKEKIEEFNKDLGTIGQKYENTPPPVNCDETDKELLSDMDITLLSGFKNEWVNSGNSLETKQALTQARTDLVAFIANTFENEREVIEHMGKQARAAGYS